MPSRPRRTIEHKEWCRPCKVSYSKGNSHFCMQGDEYYTERIVAHKFCLCNFCIGEDLYWQHGTPVPATEPRPPHTIRSIRFTSTAAGWKKRVEWVCEYCFNDGGCVRPLSGRPTHAGPDSSVRTYDGQVQRMINERYAARMTGRRLREAAEDDVVGTPRVEQASDNVFEQCLRIPVTTPYSNWQVATAVPSSPPPTTVVSDFEWQEYSFPASPYEDDIEDDWDDDYDDDDGDF